MKQNKTLILGALIITLSIVIIGISLSYAYYTNSITEKNSANKAFVFTSGELVMNFTTTSYINITNAALTNEATVISNNSNATEFTITLPSSSKASSVNCNIYLTDIKMTTNFKNADVKWALYEGASSVASGNFSSLGDPGTTEVVDGVTLYNYPNLNLKNNITISRNVPKTYKLYIWLNRTDANQNSLLEGVLRAKVGFVAST